MPVQIEKQPPALIADLPADGADRATVVQWLRNNRPDLRVILTAGYPDAFPDITPLPEGAAILQKPFSGDSLGGKIRELLNRPDPT